MSEKDKTPRDGASQDKKKDKKEARPAGSAVTRPQIDDAPPD